MAFYPHNANGRLCKECVTKVHELSEYDVFCAHSQFEARTPQEQNQWIVDYFMSHCRVDEAGVRDAKAIIYIVSEKNVCLNVWLKVLSISVSRFYRGLFGEWRKLFTVIQMV